MKKTLEEMFETAYRYARFHGRIGIYEEDDIVQNVMLKLIARDPMPATTGWLYKTVRSVAYDAHRAQNRHKQYIDFYNGPESFYVNEPSLESTDRMQSIAAKRSDVEIDLMPQLKGVMAKLSSPLRVALILHAEGYTNEEIALMTNTNVGTVKSRLFYARRRAQKFMPDVA
jgi:RNA polymerase sigma factor (sigma-70 family)